MRKTELNIWRKRIAKTYNDITRRMRLLKVNRELLVFFVFFCIAIIFWFLQAFKENTNLKLDYQICLTGIPENVIITSDIPEQISVTIAGRGYDVLEYAINRKSKVIKVDYSDINKTDIALSLDNNSWKRILNKELKGAISFISASPATIEMPYSNGEKKRVPVEYAGKIKAGAQYSLCGIKIIPDSIDLYAPKNIYDSINVVYTEKHYFQDIEDTITSRLALETAHGIKVIPDSIDMQIFVDLFTEKTVSVPIYCENIPPSKVLRTFPLKAQLTFRVSANQFNNINEENFVVVVDYNQIKENSRNCKLILRSQPSGVSNVRISPETVEFIIEQIEG